MKSNRKDPNAGRQSGNRTSLVARMRSAVGRLLSRSRRDEETPSNDVRIDARPARKTPRATARPVQRPTDIPMDVIGNIYTPAGTSSKSGFRSDGSDHQIDQEYAFGTADERWNDEDRLTNKSGDPRIGTRGRTYEPGETRADSQD